ncbi:MAG: thiamine-phosphate kinase [Candidatus Thermoplasmatota archaeon]|nr:thiamine-phosphate kinase [Candidatus Thermoplasmatota archaeon]
MKRLSDFGERKAIQIISNILSKGKIAVGIGDDCAAFAFGKNYLLVTTDMISEKNHIPEIMSPWQIGWFIVAINLSDIAAKGGTPLGLVLSLGLPRNTSERFLRDLMRGADRCATQNNTVIVGGDTKENDEITLCGTAFGLVKKDEFMGRKGAKPGDVIAVTGVLGRAAAGYYAIRHGNRNREILKGLLEPVPKIKEGEMLAKTKVVTSSMDISDGLSSSLYQLQGLNKVGFEVDKEEIPLSPMLLKLGEKHGFDVYSYAMHFGGDYELLVTIPLDSFKKAQETIENIGGSLTKIGRVIKERKIIVKSNGKIRVLENRGYEHFIKRRC